VLCLSAILLPTRTQRRKHGEMLRLLRRHRQNVVLVAHASNQLRSPTPIVLHSLQWLPLSLLLLRLLLLLQRLSLVLRLSLQLLLLQLLLLQRRLRQRRWRLSLPTSMHWQHKSLSATKSRSEATSYSRWRRSSPLRAMHASMAHAQQSATSLTGVAKRLLSLPRQIGPHSSSARTLKQTAQCLQRIQLVCPTLPTSATRW
jgi:hypothetical protein